MKTKYVFVTGGVVSGLGKGITAASLGRLLKNRGYKLYLLTNITDASYNYINEQMNIDSLFEGGIYSYQEHLVKPNEEIYKLILDRYNLNKEETIFFDDREKNVLAANKVGLKSIVFKSIKDIENNI